MNKEMKAGIKYLENEGLEILEENCNKCFSVVARNEDQIRFVKITTTEIGDSRDIHELMPSRKQLEQDMIEWLKNKNEFGSCHFDLLDIKKISGSKALVRYVCNAKDKTEYEEGEV